MLGVARMNPSPVTRQVYIHINVGQALQGIEGVFNARVNITVIGTGFYEIQIGRKQNPLFGKMKCAVARGVPRGMNDAATGGSEDQFVPVFQGWGSSSPGPERQVKHQPESREDFDV